MSEWWEYDQLESGAPYDWHPAGRGDNPDDNIDFHIDLGAGRLPKGRLALDRHGSCDINIDFNTLELIDSRGPLEQKGKSLPFPDNSIESIISHHCLEHIGDGFLRLMDECYRVLKPKGKFRIIVPLFPSLSAVTDPDHVRYFTKDTFQSFCHEGGEGTPFWSDVFAEPYTKCRFKMTDRIYSPAKTLRQIKEERDYDSEHMDTMNFLTIDDIVEEPREIRVTLQKP